MQRRNFKTCASSSEWRFRDAGRFFFATERFSIIKEVDGRSITSLYRKGITVMNKHLCRFAVMALVAGAMLSTDLAAREKSAAKTRTFLFTYAGMVKDLPPGKEARVWLPVAESGPEQEVTIHAKKLPGESNT